MKSDKPIISNECQSDEIAKLYLYPHIDYVEDIGQMSPDKDMFLIPLWRLPDNNPLVNLLHMKIDIFYFKNTYTENFMQYDYPAFMPMYVVSSSLDVLNGFCSKDINHLKDSLLDKKNLWESGIFYKESIKGFVPYNPYSLILGNGCPASINDKCIYNFKVMIKIRLASGDYVIGQTFIK